LGGGRQVIMNRKGAAKILEKVAPEVAQKKKGLGSKT